MLKPKPNPLPKPHFAKNKLPFPLTIKILQLIYFHRELLVIPNPDIEKIDIGSHMDLEKFFLN
jgi:hypothetical protein